MYDGAWRVASGGIDGLCVGWNERGGIIDSEVSLDARKKKFLCEVGF
jgi:hypothetical protein